MIKNSFIFLTGMTLNKEKKLWKQGIKNWNDFLNIDKIKGISQEKKEEYNKELIKTKEELLNDNLNLFLKFPSKETWRLYEHLRNEAVYLDIEIGSNRKDIILIGLFDGFNTKIMVKNYNLAKNVLLNELKRYKLLITFNGKSFDVPAIEKYFGIEIDLPHIDLKHLCLKLGLKNGLKEVEKILNLKRPVNLYGKPYDAYKAFMASGDKEYLELLIKYNEEDIINLKPIMEYTFKNLKDKLYIF